MTGWEVKERLICSQSWGIPTLGPDDFQSAADNDPSEFTQKLVASYVAWVSHANQLAHKASSEFELDSPMKTYVDSITNLRAKYAEQFWEHAQTLAPLSPIFSIDNVMDKKDAPDSSDRKSQTLQVLNNISQQIEYASHN